jgi:sugar transferase (PEP-CTERM/EpsH1 system associated)
MSSRILYITHRVPWPPDRGDRIRTWNVLKFLATRATVDLICLADEPVSHSTMAELRPVTQRLAVIPHTGIRRYARGLWSLLTGRTVTEGLFESPQLRSRVRDWSHEHSYDAVLASSSGIARYILPPVCESASIRARWVDLIDVDSQKWFDYSAAAAFPMSIVYRTEGRRLRRVEQQLAQKCDRLLVVSEAEQNLFRSFCPTPNIAAAGNGVDTQYFSANIDQTADPFSCVFVGVMNYRPNVDAVVWFAESVWPQIRSAFPAAVFRIVGKSPCAEVCALAKQPGIEVVGSVPDVRPWLNRSACVVVPLRIARGVQNKVLEAMSCARPVICSSAPLKGLRAEPGFHVLKADEATEWVAAIRRVFMDPALQNELGLAASAFVQIHHSWDQCLAPLTELTEFAEQPTSRTGTPARSVEVPQ